MRRQVVQVVWTDSAGRNGWSSLEEGQGEDLMQVVSVGWLVAEHEDRVVLGQSLTDERVADTLAIPRRMVVSMEPMRLTGRRR